MVTAALVMGHGAGGGVESKDIQTAREVALEAGISSPWSSSRIGSPAGARPPRRSRWTAWTAVVEHLKADELEGLELIAGGRLARCSGGVPDGRWARSRCLCVAFPPQPPQRGKPLAPDRLGELEVSVPTLVVQGESDQFGIPPEGPNRRVVLVPGTYTLRHMDPIAAAVRDWLAGPMSGGPRAGRYR